MEISKKEILAALGTSLANEVVTRLHRAAHLPRGVLENLSHSALSEN